MEIKFYMETGEEISVFGFRDMYRQLLSVVDEYGPVEYARIFDGVMVRGAEDSIGIATIKPAYPELGRARDIQKRLC